MALVSSKLRYLLFAYAIFSIIQFGLRLKSYDVSPKQFKTVAGKAAAAPTAKQALSTLTVGLRSHYEPILPKHIEWHAIQLGGLSLRIFPIYTAFTEYAAAFTAPFTTSGRAGLHWANSTCTVLKGQVERYADDTQDDTKETFAQGGAFRHGQFESYLYSFEKDTLVACYGRGFLPISSTTTIISGISVGEPLSAIRLYTSLLGNYYNSISHSVQRTFQHYKARATGEL
ncbi:unnamed protein product [Caenorhabditis sp. 36 PRJEB53466]|nr:unnamed protein product [Caenorhabditis sp. 36 PRJEB53466]